MSIWKHSFAIPRSTVESFAFLSQRLALDRLSGRLTWRMTDSHSVKIGDETGYSFNRAGVKVLRVDGRLLMKARVVWVLFNGRDLPPRHRVIHVNGDLSDFSPMNLEAKQISPAKTKRISSAEAFSKKVLNEVFHLDSSTGRLYRRKSDGTLKGPCEFKNRNGYLSVSCKGHSFLAHHVVWVLSFGTPIPDGYRVSHRNGDGTDNRPFNLRLSTQAQATRSSKIYKNNSSGAKGVSELKNGMWVASVGFDGNLVHIGSFGEISDALNARNRAASGLHGEFFRVR